jgi:hypothetical protein
MELIVQNKAKKLCPVEKQKLIMKIATGNGKMINAFIKINSSQLWKSNAHVDSFVKWEKICIKI